MTETATKAQVISVVLNGKVLCISEQDAKTQGKEDTADTSVSSHKAGVKVYMYRYLLSMYIKALNM